MGTLRNLASKAGRWLGLNKETAAAPEPATGAVLDSKFDTIAWADVLDQSAALRRMAASLHESYDYTDDLIRDMFLCAYKAQPQLRDREQMLPSRWPNRQIIAGMLTSPEMADLRGDTVGDPYACAMAVLSQGSALREALQKAKDAQSAADAAEEARKQARQAAEALAAAMAEAAAAAGQQEAPEEDAADDEQGAAAGVGAGTASGAGAGGVVQADQDATDPGDVDDVDPENGAHSTGGEDDEVPAEVQELIEAAIRAAEEAQAAADQAGQDAEEACDNIAAALRTTMRRGLDSAVERAEAEAAVAASWGVDPAELQRMDFEQRAALAARLASPQMRHFAELIGRFRAVAIGERARRIEHVRGERVGITLGNDLSALIPSEIVNLSIPALRASFAARYADGRLMQYDSRGEIEAGYGAIIACIDTSSSMRRQLAGGITGELWSKAVTLALLDQARAAGRDFVAILFADPGRTAVYRFPAGQTRIGDVIDFTEKFLAGGTDFVTPLNEALSILEDQYSADGTQRGDIVLVTDGECDVPEDWMRAWIEAKTRLDFRVFGLSVDAGVGRVLDALSDNARSVTDLTDADTIRDLFRII